MLNQILYPYNALGPYPLLILYLLSLLVFLRVVLNHLDSYDPLQRGYCDIGSLLELVGRKLHEGELIPYLLILIAKGGLILALNEILPHEPVAI